MKLPTLADVRWREPLLWSLAIGMGLITAFGARTFLEQRAEVAQARVEQRYRPRQVVVARQNLAPGTLLEADSLAVRRMPGDYLPASAVFPDDAGALRGRTLAHAVAAGQPIQNALLQPVQQVRLAERVALGRRAVTLAVDDTDSAAGLLQPGDRIDLHWRGEAGREAHSVANLEVLATGDRIIGVDAQTGERYGTLTVEVTAEQAVALAKAGAGSPEVSLRNPRDVGIVAEPRRIVQRAPTGLLVPLIVGGQGGPTPGIRVLAGGAP